MSVGMAYNEVEENAEGNGLTADAASLGVSGRSGGRVASLELNYLIQC